LCTKMIILPRQARDKHRGSSKQRTLVMRFDRAMRSRPPLW
jgi:hypothetical protein